MGKKIKTTLLTCRVEMIFGEHMLVDRYGIFGLDQDPVLLEGQIRIRSSWIRSDNTIGAHKHSFAI
jgi:hypothetical protein